eukprot:2656877-Ditylum_brightwellii.AAC.1
MGNYVFPDTCPRIITQGTSWLHTCHVGLRRLQFPDISPCQVTCSPAKNLAFSVMSQSFKGSKAGCQG